VFPRVGKCRLGWPWWFQIGPKKVRHPGASPIGEPHPTAAAEENAEARQGTPPILVTKAGASLKSGSLQVGLGNVFGNDFPVGSGLAASPLRAEELPICLQERFTKTAAGSQ
jgi:hypothetical protein